MLVALGIFVVISVAEIYAIAQAGGLIGALPTVTLLVLLCAMGAWVVKYEGLMAWRNVALAIRDGRMPTAELIDGLMVLAAGALLLIPGFITGFVGILLAIPLFRRLVRPAIVTVVSARVGRRVRLVGDNLGNNPFTAGAQGPQRPRRRRDSDDIIDLHAEEYFIDEPSGELEAGPDGEPDD